MKQYSSNHELSNKITIGVNKLADNVASTLGPRGRNVIIQKKDARPVVTKDGVLVAEFVDLTDPFENLGAQIIKQASRKTNSEAGDGTTTATVLARAIYKNAVMKIAAGYSPIDIKRGIDRGVGLVVENLKDFAKPISSLDDIRHIATISANNDPEIGELICKAVEAIGKDGSIGVEEAKSVNTTLDLVEGFRFDSGYVSSSFINNERRGAVVYENAFIFVVDSKVEKVEEILPVLEIVAREGRPLIIVASELEGQALAALIMNTVRGTMKVAAVKAPRYGEERRSIMQDLCVSVGATFFTRNNVGQVTLEGLGQAKKVEILKNMTTIIDGKGDYQEIEKRLDSLRVELSQTDSLAEGERIQERITRLSSAIAIIKVGAATEIEMIEKKHRIEDALEAVKAAREEGIVPGGGVALLRSIPKNSKLWSDAGAAVVFESLSEPLKQMSLNAGESADVIVDKVARAKGSKGWDFKTNKVVDMYSIGVIDPVKVTRCALQNAASAAGTLITTGYAIVETE